MTPFDEAFISEAEACLLRGDLIPEERRLLDHQVRLIREGSVTLTGPDTVDAWFDRQRNHYP